MHYQMVRNNAELSFAERQQIQRLQAERAEFRLQLQVEAQLEEHRRLSSMSRQFCTQGLISCVPPSNPCVSPSSPTLCVATILSCLSLVPKSRAIHSLYPRVPPSRRLWPPAWATAMAVAKATLATCIGAGDMGDVGSSGVGMGAGDVGDVGGSGVGIGAGDMGDVGGSGVGIGDAADLGDVGGGSAGIGAVDMSDVGSSSVGIGDAADLGDVGGSSVGMGDAADLGDVGGGSAGIGDADDVGGGSPRYSRAVGVCTQLIIYINTYRNSYLFHACVRRSCGMYHARTIRPPSVVPQLPCRRCS